MPYDRAIVFDLDDTLYPERDYVFSGFAAVAESFSDLLGPSDQSMARMRALFDTTDRGRVFDVLAGELGLPDAEALVQGMIAAYRTHHPTITLYPDAEVALSRLRPASALGLITDGYAVVQHAKIDALRLRERFDAVTVTDDWGREFWKPHPMAFGDMAQRLGVAPEACTYVADNLAKDFVAPNRLGWNTIHIRRPEAVHAHIEPPEGGMPKQCVTTLDEIA